MRARLLIAGFIFIGAVTYLAVAGIRSGWVYYLEVDEFLADEQFHSHRVRLHGTVTDEAFSASRGTLTASFLLLGKVERIAVTYQGTIPDLFEPGQQVVVEGRFDSSGIFKADVLMTKCASKYEPASPHADVAQPAPATHLTPHAATKGA